MKEVAPHDRPREKLERLGAAALGDNELLALVLGSGSRARDVLEMANVLLEQRGGLHGLTRSTAADLCAIAGVGAARAAQVLAAVELGRRTLVRTHADRPRLNTPRQLASYLLPQHGSRPGGANKGPDRLRGKYYSFESTPLQATVQEQSNQLPAFDLKSS